MSELRRFLTFVKPYWSPLTLSVLLMALAGAAHGLMAALIKPIFDRVLNPSSANQAVEIVKLPFSTTPLYLHQLVPSFISQRVDGSRVRHSRCFPGSRIVRLLRQLPGELGRRECGNRYPSEGLRQAAASRRAILRIALHRPDHVVRDERHRQDPDGDVQHARRLAATKSSPRLRLLYIVLQRDWRLGLVSLTVLPIVLVPTIRIGRRIRRTTRRAQDNAAELNEILQETIVGQQVVKAFGSEKHESARFHAAAWRLRNANLRYVCPAGHRFAADRVLRRALPLSDC